MLELTRSMAYRARSVVGTAVHNLAIQDVMALLFHTYVLYRATMAPDSYEATLAGRASLALLTITVCGFVLSRGEVLQSARARGLVYRVALFAPLLLSYFEMRFLLPALQPELLDLQLYAIDQWMIGTTPAVWMEQFNTQPVIEWVSFFYYMYFGVMILMIIPALFFDKGRRQAELIMGAAVVAACGHALYTVVPGAGPYATLEFAEPLNGAFWWRQVQVTVAAAGSQIDIFPSLHTAYPTFFALHAFGHRRTKAFRYTWPILAFFAVNIILATMMLRWHWLIDVIAGLALAFAARRIGMAVAERERVRGTPRDVRQQVFEPIW